MIRAILRLQKFDDGCLGYAARISPHLREDWALIDHIRECGDEIVSQLPRVKRMQPGQAATFDLWLKPWDHTTDGPDGRDYNAGVDVMRSRCLRMSKPTKKRSKL